MMIIQSQHPLSTLYNNPAMDFTIPGDSSKWFESGLPGTKAKIYILDQSLQCLLLTSSCTCFVHQHSAVPVVLFCTGPVEMCM